jgi:hypothetical protein
MIQISRFVSLSKTVNQWVPGSSPPPGGGTENPATFHESWIFLDLEPVPFKIKSPKSVHERRSFSIRNSHVVGDSPGEGPLSQEVGHHVKDKTAKIAKAAILSKTFSMLTIKSKCPANVAQ